MSRRADRKHEPLIIARVETLSYQSKDSISAYHAVHFQGDEPSLLMTNLSVRDAMFLQIFKSCCRAEADVRHLLALYFNENMAGVEIPDEG